MCGGAISSLLHGLFLTRELSSALMKQSSSSPLHGLFLTRELSTALMKQSSSSSSISSSSTLPVPVSLGYLSDARGTTYG